MHHVSDAERRARLATRHGLGPGFQVDSPEAVTRAMTVLHATEPATVYLSCQARVPGLGVTDVDRALYVDRTVMKQLAMRRTLFVFPADLLPGVVWPSASARVAGIERARLAKDIEAAWGQRRRGRLDRGGAGGDARRADPDAGRTPGRRAARSRCPWSM